MALILNFWATPYFPINHPFIYLLYLSIFINIDFYFPIIIFFCFYLLSTFRISTQRVIYKATLFIRQQSTDSTLHRVNRLLRSSGTQPSSTAKTWKTDPISQELTTYKETLFIRTTLRVNHSQETKKAQQTHYTQDSYPQYREGLPSKHTYRPVSKTGCLVLLLSLLSLLPFTTNHLKHNQYMRATHGNHTCSTCNCHLGHWTFYNTPKKFHSFPIQLPNGMLVHHTHFCYSHTSIWYYRRGKRQYQSFQGTAKLRLDEELKRAGAARGLPGDHGHKKSHFSSYQYNIPHPNRTSGHEPCRASQGRTHQNLRSPERIKERHNKYNTERRHSRTQYRAWRSSLRWGGSTLPLHHSPVLKVQVSSNSQRRHYPPHTLKPTSYSRTNFFKTYVTRDRLDDPPSRLDNFATPSRKLQLYSWNIETLIGVGKYEQFQNIAHSLPIGIFCLQETKSTHSDILKFPKLHFYLSGWGRLCHPYTSPSYSLRFPSMELSPCSSHPQY